MARHAITILTIAAIILAAASGLFAEPMELTVLTYNTHLFRGVNPTIGDHMPQYEDEIRRGHIINKIKGSNADIVALQEVWGDPWVTDYFIPGLHANYPYTAYMYKGCNSYVWGLDTLSHGVLLLSKWPISNERFEPFPTFFPSCAIENGCDNWANKGVWTATVDVNGMPIRVGVSHALTGPDDAKSKWESAYVANSITSFQLNGQAYIFALQDTGDTAHIRQIEDYSYIRDKDTGTKGYGAGWKEVCAGYMSSDFRAVVSFELNGHPHLFALKSDTDQAYILRINNDPSTGWQTFGPYFWDKDYRPTAITSFQLNGQAYIFGLKSGWNQAWFYRINTDPSTGEFNPLVPFEEFGWKPFSRWFGAITSFESNGRPWLYCLKSNYDQVYIQRINEDPSTGKLNRNNQFTEFGPFTQAIDRHFIGETITSFQLNGRAYIFGVKSGWDQAWLYRINPDPSTGLVSLGWKPWTRRDYVAVESFEMNGHPYLFGLSGCGEHLNCCVVCVPVVCDSCILPLSPYATYPSRCDPCLRGFPGEANLKRINDDPSDLTSDANKWEDLYQLEDMKIIRDATVAEDGPPAIMMGDFNIHRGKYGIMDQLFRKAGAVDAYIEVHGTGEGGETTDWVENRLYQIFWPDVNPNDPDAVDRIDYVYFKPSGSGLRLVPTEAYVIRDWKYYSAGAAGNMDLSDHYPLVVRFRLDPGCPIPLKGDFDCDHVVGFPDLAILCSAWLSGPGGGAWDRACDMSDPGDDFIGMKDFDAFAGQWGSTLVVNVTQNTWHVDIQTAINDANDGDEIEVGPRTYYEAINFKGKAVTLRSTDPTDPNVVAATVINGIGNYHVVQCVSGEDANTILAGFTITGGLATGSSFPDNCGAGMLNENSKPTLINCTFRDNWAQNDGGGMYNVSSSPTLMDCTFSGNEADVHGGGMCNITGSSPTLTLCLFSANLALSTGGGMINSANSSPVMTDCTFTDNVAYGDGGGMINNSSSSPKLTDCTFTGNSADGFANGNGDGGGIHNASSNPTLTNCIFSQNTAQSYGGGMYNTDGRATLTNCIFYENTAWTASGGGYANYNGSNSTLINCTVYQNWAGHGLRNWDSTLVVTNCIVRYNYPSEISSEGSSSLTVSYSNIYGGWSGTGNIDEWPFFVDPDGGDLRLSSGSPCIDTGSNAAVSGIATDLDGNPRVLDGDSNGTVIVDMGAYEYLITTGNSLERSLEAYCILAANWLEAPWPRQPDEAFLPVPAMQDPDLDCFSERIAYYRPVTR